MSSNRDISVNKIAQLAGSWIERGDPSWTRDDWARLEKRLYVRRLELDPRYATFKTFIAERGVNYRLAWDLENATGEGRMNVGWLTLAEKVDPAYGWEPGGCQNVLDGLEPVPLPGTPGARPKRPVAAVPPPVPQLPADMSPEELGARFLEFLESLDRKKGRGEQSA
jgi:hypothetical protein